MADDPRPRPLLIPPPSRQVGHLEVVRERPTAHRAVQHPHCEDHFLFTPYCAACLEAEQTQAASAQVISKAEKGSVSKPQAPQSSRSFGFADGFPHALAHGLDPANGQLTDRDVQTIADILLDI